MAEPDAGKTRKPESEFSNIFEDGVPEFSPDQLPDLPVLPDLSDLFPRSEPKFPDPPEASKELRMDLKSFGVYEEF